MLGNPAIGIPFLPGGFEKSDNLENLLETPFTESTIDWSNLTVDPPGMKGMPLNLVEKTEITLESLIKDEIEDETFNWIPKFKPKDDIQEDILEENEPEIALVDEIQEIEIVENIDKEVKLEPEPVWMINADKTVDVSKPWKELLPDPAYKVR